MLFEVGMLRTPLPNEVAGKTIGTVVPWTGVHSLVLRRQAGVCSACFVCGLIDTTWQ